MTRHGTSIAAALCLLLRASPGAAQERVCTLERVIDGDTVVCRGGERVRLIGIDSPEMSRRPLGALSRSYLRSIVSPGTRLRVELDVEARDRYGRLLAYLYLPDGRMVNLVMVRAGYAQPYTFPPNVRYVDEILAASRTARARGAGLWGRPGFGDDPPPGPAQSGGAVSRMMVPPTTMTSCPPSEVTETSLGGSPDTSTRTPASSPA